MVLQDNFNKYIGFARSIMSTLPPDEVPVELNDTLLFVKACSLFVGYQQRLDVDDVRDAAETVESGYKSCRSMVKVGRAASRSHGKGSTFPVLRAMRAC